MQALEPTDSLFPERGGKPVGNLIKGSPLAYDRVRRDNTDHPR